jgi:arginyl-tRNA synthetase
VEDFKVMEKVEVSDSQEFANQEIPENNEFEKVDPQKAIKKERSKTKKAVKKLLAAQGVNYDDWLHEQHLAYLEKIRSAFSNVDAVLK